MKEFKRFVNAVWEEDFDFITIDITKKKNESIYRQNLDTIFLPSIDPFN